MLSAERMRSTSVQAVFPLRLVGFSLRSGWFKSTLLKLFS